MQKKTVLIDRSLSNEERAVPVDLPVVIVGKNFIPVASVFVKTKKIKGMCPEGYVTNPLTGDFDVSFVFNNLLSGRTEDIIDKALGKAGWLAIGYDIQ